MNNIKTFTNTQLGEIRTLTDGQGEPRFVGKDVAEALRYSNPRKALNDHVDEEDKGVTKRDTPGGQQAMTIINESGLYSLILSSKLASAKQFKRWVTTEVLPQIRKTGGYIPTKAADGRTLTAEEVMARADEIIGRTLQLVNAPNTGCLTATDVARAWGLETSDFNQLLRRMGIQQRRGGRWCLAPQLEGKGLTEVRCFAFYSLQGKRRMKEYMVWTPAGLDYLNHRFLSQPHELPRIVQLLKNRKKQGLIVQTEAGFFIAAYLKKPSP
ncbi:MAG: phage antirepressor [Prevotella sp.]|nr:phage antirepressor [Prevotella sp.]